jgi:hypothetical protein
MKSALLVLCLTSSIAFAQESIYDYQGHVMTGTSDFYGQVIPDSETYTASLTFHGLLTSPNTDFDVQVTSSGTSGTTRLIEYGCSMDGSCPFNNTTSIILNKSGNTLKSADITIPDFNVVIGPKGDNIIAINLDGVTVISVSNDTPGTWMKVPELDASGAFGAITLLGACVLMVRASGGNRRCFEG